MQASASPSVDRRRGGRRARRAWATLVRRGRRRVAPRTLLRAGIFILAVLLASTAWGVATASAEASLGPHVARYEVTLDHQVTIDLGPLGTVVIDSPLPLTLGARVVVQEIPREVTAVDDAATLDAVAADLQGYIQFFTGPEATLEVAVRALVVDAARRAALAAAVIVAVTGLSRVALGPGRRAELASELRPYRAVTAGATVLALAISGTLTRSTPLDEADTMARPASGVFDDTPLEGARITGRLSGIIDTYGGYLVDAYKSNEVFYDRATADLKVAWEARAAADDRLQAAVGGAAVSLSSPPGSAPSPPSPSVAPASTPSGSPAAATDRPTHAVSPSPSGTPDPTPTQEPPGSEPLVLLVVSDLHCNVGMARVIRAAVELSGARIVLNAGDTTINGTAVEQYCVTAFAAALPDGVTMVVSDGNHDSADTADHERRAGARVLDGETIEVEGIRVLGDGDPSATRIGIGTVLSGQETVGQAGRRLADVACAEPAGVDLLLVHNPNMGNAALAQGCAPAQVSGHRHRRQGPDLRGPGVLYVSSSTAGAALDQPTVGPLNGPAEMTVLRFDPDMRRFLDHRVVSIQPDGTVRVGFAVRWPTAPVVFPPEGGPR